MMGVLMRRDADTRDTPWEEGLVKMEAETRVKPVQAKGRQGQLLTPAASKRRGTVPPQSLESLVLLAP